MNDIEHLKHVYKIKRSSLICDITTVFTYSMLNITWLRFYTKYSFFFVIIICYFRRAGGDRIYGVFDHQLPAALKKLPIDRHLSLQNVRKVVSEADGYQPHLIAPEQGYRRLIEGSLNFFKGPAEASVDAVISLSFPASTLLLLYGYYNCMSWIPSQLECPEIKF